MKRTPRIGRRVSSPVFAAVVLLVPAVTSASLADADDGPGPFGVTAVAAAGGPTDRVGALFGADRAGKLAGGHFCTASVVHSPGRDLVVTAAHCLDGDGGLIFVPGYRDGKAPYGVWTVRRRFLPDGWAKGQDEDSDVAFAVVAAKDGKDGKGVEDVVGGNRFVTGTATGATAVTVTGYPNSREVPVSCTNKPTAHSSTQQRIDCPALSGGTSGSPWVNGDGQVVGVLGGHEEGGSTDDISYSVVLGTEAAELYRDATADP
ncbi:trypsin-like peptidase domain-containing protein [Streptomyces panaciradicis]|uniref:trypsin-like peptidase domain-containing protein n=1 Tax=Streptomyces panaciradicis TaxID=1470261 RepID=UPI00201CCD10|nr:trypsin-like peptidase domain-containing protein [Streptomyces panaciradicis]MCL6668343.1 trypsin-like peptidase domain-containing protein [Streptomyces panaciradicis]